MSRPAQVFNYKISEKNRILDNALQAYANIVVDGMNI